MSPSGKSSGKRREFSRLFLKKVRVLGICILVACRGASRFRGVTKHHDQGKWEARISQVNGNRYVYLGAFWSEEEAARVRKRRSHLFLFCFCLLKQLMPVILASKTLTTPPPPPPPPSLRVYLQAYDIAAIKHRGLSTVTNFQLSSYKLEQLAKAGVKNEGIDETGQYMTRRYRLALYRDWASVFKHLPSHHLASLPLAQLLFRTLFLYRLDSTVAKKGAVLTAKIPVPNQSPTISQHSLSNTSTDRVPTSPFVESRRMDNPGFSSSSLESPVHPVSPSSSAPLTSSTVVKREDKMQVSQDTFLHNDVSQAAVGYYPSYPENSFGQF